MTASRDNGVRLWEATVARPVESAHNYNRSTWAAFSPDGRTFVTAGEKGGISRWDTGSGKLVGKLVARDVQALASSPDGRLLLMGDPSRAAGLDLAAAHWVRAPLSLRGTVRTVAVSPDGHTLLAADDFPTLCPWPPPPVDGDVRRVALLIQIDTALELGDDNIIRRVDAETWRPWRRMLDEAPGISGR